MTLEDVEREAIIAAFLFHRRNKTHTAASIGIGVRTLDYKIAKFEADGHLQREVKSEIQVPG